MKLLGIFLLAVRADICGKISLRPDEPFGQRVGFNIDTEALPEKTVGRQILA